MASRHFRAARSAAGCNLPAAAINGWLTGRSRQARPDDAAAGAATGRIGHGIAPKPPFSRSVSPLGAEPGAINGCPAARPPRGMVTRDPQARPRTRPAPVDPAGRNDDQPHPTRIEPVAGRTSVSGSDPVIGARWRSPRHGAVLPDAPLGVIGRCLRPFWGTADQGGAFGLGPICLEPASRRPGATLRPGRAAGGAFRRGAPSQAGRHRLACAPCAGPSRTS